MPRPGADSLSGEDRLIERFLRPIATDPRALGLSDDVAVMPPPGADLVLKADAIVAGVHFFDDDPPDTVARKALRVNLSDLAAKGAEPSGYLMTLALPRGGLGDDWLARFAEALRQDGEAYGCALLGGDIVATPGPLTIAITAIGLTPCGALVRRSGARRDQHVVVSGTIGDAALGLALRRDPPLAGRLGLTPAMVDHLLARYRLPQPRTALAGAVRQYASGAMDVSDGLAGDLAKLCRASQLGATLERARVPLSPAARAAVTADPALWPAVLTGGDDYEILCTVDKARYADFAAAAAAAETPVAIVGATGEEGPSTLRDEAGAPLVFPRMSFSHF